MTGNRTERRGFGYRLQGMELGWAGSGVVALRRVKKTEQLKALKNLIFEEGTPVTDALRF